jgi:hypothetical protein
MNDRYFQMRKLKQATATLFLILASSVNTVDIPFHAMQCKLYS